MSDTATMERPTEQPRDPRNNRGICHNCVGRKDATYEAEHGAKSGSLCNEDNCKIRPINEVPLSIDTQCGKCKNNKGNQDGPKPDAERDALVKEMCAKGYTLAEIGVASGGHGAKYIWQICKRLGVKTKYAPGSQRNNAIRVNSDLWNQNNAASRGEN